jgi:hypothetical protein
MNGAGMNSAGMNSRHEKREALTTTALETSSEMSFPPRRQYGPAGAVMDC